MCLLQSFKIDLDILTQCSDFLLCPQKSEISLIMKFEIFLNKLFRDYII